MSSVSSCTSTLSSKEWLVSLPFTLCTLLCTNELCAAKPYAAKELRLWFYVAPNAMHVNAVLWFYVAHNAIHINDVCNIKCR